jgi:hypothetical protein
MKQIERFYVKTFTNPSGAQAWRVMGYRPGGVQVRLNFKTQAEALAKKNELEVEALGMPVSAALRSTRLTDAQLTEAEGAFQRLGDRSLTAMVDFWLANYKESTIQVQIAEACDRFLFEMKGSNLRPRTIQDLRSRLKLLRVRCGSVFVDKITTDTLRPLVYRKTGQSPHTTNGNIRVLSWFFNWCLRMKYASQNPVLFRQAEADDSEDPEILSLPQVKSLLWAAHTYKNGVMARYVAQSLFAGLRPRETSLVPERQIDLTKKRIKIKGPQAKLRQRRTVAIEDNLVVWNLCHRKRPVYPRNWRRHFDAVRRLAGFRVEKADKDETRPAWASDVLRHTALSYHYGRCKDENQTAAWAGNSPAVLHKHYRDDVSAEEVAEFWRITPETLAAEMEKSNITQTTPETAPVGESTGTKVAA